VGGNFAKALPLSGEAHPSSLIDFCLSAAQERLSALPIQDLARAGVRISTFFFS